MTTPGLREGAVAIVTGGGRGLGRAFALALAGAGARVVVADLDPRSGEAVAAEIRGAGGAAEAFVADVADEPSVAALAAGVDARFGTATILVNNAAVFVSLALKQLAEITVEEWDAVSAVNNRGMFLCCRAFAPVMARAGYGKIINVASSQFWVGRAGYPHYVASKGAAIGLTRALATELGPRGIRVNAIAPGATVTEVPRAGINDEILQRIAAQTALRRCAGTADIVGPVLFLASQASDFVTGQTLIVDGGVSYS